MHTSILEKGFIDDMLRTTQSDLEQDGWSVPFLFLQMAGPRFHTNALVYSQSLEEKQAYFAALGAQLRQAGQMIEAAVFLWATWLVLATEAPAACAVRPRPHPRRQEAIVAVGRDAANVRQTFVAQPFIRAGYHKLVWEPIAIASYDAPVEKGMKAVGLLDCLFAANQQR